MLVINLQNIEDLILRNNELRLQFPDLRHVIDQWMLSQRLPALRSLRLRSLMDLMNLFREEHIIKLEKFFKDTVALDKIDYHIIKNETMSVDSVELEDNGFANFAISRNKDSLKITFWK